MVECNVVVSWQLEICDKNCSLVSEKLKRTGEEAKLQVVEDLKLEGLKLLEHWEVWGWWNKVASVPEKWLECGNEGAEIEFCH